jgi:tRNA1Val (adenine37-N6)-methyltransferase
VGRKFRIQDALLGDLTDDRLTRDYRVFQRADGHRFSVDDVATAHVAATAHEAWSGAPPKRILDLGTGLGSVLLHLAWVFQDAELVGIEAQDASFELLRRNIERNRLQNRVRILHGDIRDTAILAQAGRDFDLVSGTPPYFPEGSALDAHDAQRAYARVEYRGGVEAYVQAGAYCMHRVQDSALVLCGDSHANGRVQNASKATETAELSVSRRTDIVAKEGKQALFSVWTLVRACDKPLAISELTLRTTDGSLTRDAKMLRAFSGFETPDLMR